MLIKSKDIYFSIVPVTILNWTKMIRAKKKWRRIFILARFPNSKPCSQTDTHTPTTGTECICMWVHMYVGVARSARGACVCVCVSVHSKVKNAHIQIHIHMHTQAPRALRATHTYTCRALLQVRAVEMSMLVCFLLFFAILSFNGYDEDSYRCASPLTQPTTQSPIFVPSLILSSNIGPPLDEAFLQFGMVWHSLLFFCRINNIQTHICCLGLSWLVW